MLQVFLWYTKPKDKKQGVIRMEIKADTHSHTVVSGHAYSTLREMAKAGANKGLEVLAITEHAPRMPGTCGNFYFSNFKVIPREMYGMKLLLGVELNILDEEGTVDLPEHLLKKMDIAIASIHTPCYGESKGITANTRAYINAMKNPYVDIIGHPDDGRFPVDYEALVKAARETGKLLELNNSSLTPGGFRENTRGNVMEMLKLCKKYRVHIATGSDAHIDVDAGNLRYVKEVLEECDFPEELVATTSFDKLMTYIKREKNI